MLDLKLIRDNPEGFDKALKKRGLEPLSETILALDAERRGTITALQDAQARRNQISKEVGKAKGAKDEALAQKLMAEVAALKDAIANGEAREKEISARLDEILAGTPNLPADDVPVGDESANKELRKAGKPPKFNYEPKQHFELGEALGLMDFETAAKLSGSRFVVLKGALARMERALANFMLDMHTREFGYEEVNPPFLVRDDAAFGTGQLPKFRDDLFSAQSIDQDAVSEDAKQAARKRAKQDEEQLNEIFQRLQETSSNEDEFRKNLYRAVNDLALKGQEQDRAGFIERSTHPCASNRKRH